MGKKLYVGNLTYSISSSDLRGWFTPFGTVLSTRSSQTVTRAAARGLASSRWTRRLRLRQRSRHSTTRNTTGGGLRWTKPGPGLPVPSASLVVGLVRIDRPPSRQV